MVALMVAMMMLGKWPGNHLAWPRHGCWLEVPVLGVTHKLGCPGARWPDPRLVTPGNRLGVGGYAIWPGCTQSYFLVHQQVSLPRQAPSTS